MHTHKDAEAAIEALDNRHIWEGMSSPMVVKWMDNALQRRRREQHIAAMRQGLLPSMSLGKRHGQLVPLHLHVCRERGIIHPLGSSLIAICLLRPDPWMSPSSFMPLGGGIPLPSRAGGGLMIGGGGGGLMGGFGSTGGTEMLVEVQETPPMGCSPDAIKLFVGNVPKSCTEDQLMPFFETIGKVRVIKEIDIL